jgi:hypothetical protein
MINMNLTYTETPDGYLLPDITMPEEPEVSLGRYAQMRERYLKNHKPGMYTVLLVRCKLTEHLAEIEKTARERILLITERTAKAMGVDEDMKHSDMMKWVGLMNNIKATAEQEVVRDLILA